MDVIRHIISHPRRFTKPVLTLGNFDGVHRGHQAILARVVSEARRLGGEAVAITFAPHPLAVLHPERAPAVLTSLRDKLRLLGAAGIDVVILQRFTHVFARLSPEEFVKRYVIARLRAAKLVVGHSVSFGHERRGDATLLETLGSRFGFAVEVVGPVRVEAHGVSSSVVRRTIATGDIELAAMLLGRQHRVGGRVVAGKRRGIALGFPTANIAIAEGAQYPPDGVYAVIAETGGRRYRGVANLGRNPTFGDNARTLEVHLFEFEGDLYGRRCGVSFVARLRGEIAFPSAEALSAQIRRDAEQARALLGGLA